MDIKILGPGCKNCERLEVEVVNVLADLGLDTALQKVDKVDEIIMYDVMLTPALVINEKVKVAGRVPARDELKKIIQEEIQ